MDLDKGLRDAELPNSQNWGKLLSILKKQFDEWTTNRLSEGGYDNFKIACMGVLMNIRPEGTNNNELARKARVTKQAMSKVVKELQNLGYIKSKVSAEDKRAFIVSLTDRGKKMVIEARLAMKDLTDEYRNALGKKEFDGLMSMLQRIIDYNDQKKEA